MYQLTNNYLRRFSERRDFVVSQGVCGLPRCRRRQKNRRASSLAGLLLFMVTTHPILAQEKSPEPFKGINANIAVIPGAQQQTASPAKRSITISDAVSIFLQQNLQLVAARYDIGTANAEKLTARLRPTPQSTIGFAYLPLAFTSTFLNKHQFTYAISQTL